MPNRLPDLDDQEFALLTNSLRAAAELYEMDAKTFKERSDLPYTHRERLVAQFTGQAVRTHQLMDKLEEHSTDAI